MRDDSLLWTHKPAPRCQSKPAEPLFEFVRASDGAPMSVELRFHGETYGWKVLFLERGGEFFAHGGFATRALAVLWAELERDAITR
jgi:hypothetical protein